MYVAGPRWMWKERGVTRPSQNAQPRRPRGKAAQGKPVYLMAASTAPKETSAPWACPRGTPSGELGRLPQHDPDGTETTSRTWPSVRDTRNTPTDPLSHPHVAMSWGAWNVHAASPCFQNNSVSPSESLRASEKHRGSADYGMETKKRKAEEKDSLSRYVSWRARWPPRGLCWKLRVGEAAGLTCG